MSTHDARGGKRGITTSTAGLPGLPASASWGCNCRRAPTMMMTKRGMVLAEHSTTQKYKCMIDSAACWTTEPWGGCAIR